VGNANVAVARLPFDGKAQLRRCRIAVSASAVPHALRDGKQLKELSRIRKSIGGEARMQVLQDFEVAAPAVEGQVPGTDKQMAFVLAGEDRYLRVKRALAGGDRDGLDFVILAHALRPLLAQARAQALHVGKNERLFPPPRIRASRITASKNERLKA
jgi:hypothetical protein